MRPAALVLLCCATLLPALWTPRLAAQEVVVGGDPIAIVFPPGFANLDDRARPLAEQFRRSTRAPLRLVAIGFALGDLDGASSVSDYGAALHRQLRLYADSSIENALVSERVFEDFKRVVALAPPEARAHGAGRVFLDRPRALGHSYFGYSREGIVTISAVKLLLRAHIVSAEVSMLAEPDTALPWTERVAEAWAHELMSSNGSDPVSSPPEALSR